MSKAKNKPSATADNQGPVVDTKDEQAKEPTAIEKCQAMHDKGLGEDEIIGALAKFDGMSIMKAVGVFKKFQKVAGLVLSKEDRISKIEELVGACVTVTQNADDEDVRNVDLAAASASLVKELAITGGAAKGHIRRYCKSHDVEMPSRQLLALEALSEFKDTVIKGIKANLNKSEVVAKILEFESVKDEKGAKRIYSRIAKAEGLVAARGTGDFAKIIVFLKEHGSEYVTKDGLATALVAELELTMSAAKRVWGLYNFAKLFAADPVDDGASDTATDSAA